MFCHKCGKQLDEGSNFCPYCGVAQIDSETHSVNAGNLHRQSTNSTQKNYKIIAMLLMIVNIITCFIPTYFYEKTWNYIGPGHARQTAKYGCSMFDVNTDYIAHSGPAYAFACLVLVCWVACIAVILWSILRNKDHKLIWFAPCICLVPFFTFIVYVNRAEYEWGNGFTNYSVNWMFYVSVALQICAAALMVVGMTGKELTFAFSKPTQKISEADELSKYKELLDNGVISQEEFDAKKKQLLGL